ncbi:MAG: glycosyltransferase [Chloroflexota bacterium]
MKKILIIAIGTRGDVQPAIALGKRLQTAGHTVSILASAHFKPWIEGHGLIPIPASLDVQEVMQRGGVEWVEQGHRPLVQLSVIYRLAQESGMAPIWDAWEASQGMDLIISSITSDIYAVAIAEKLSIPLVSMAFQPTVQATRSGPAMIAAPFPRQEAITNRLVGRFIYEPSPWLIYARLTNRFRQEIGLPHQGGRANRLARNRLPMLMAFSPQVVPPAADRPPQVHTTGYWFLEEEEINYRPPADLEAFLSNGPPPVYIGFGSMTRRDPGQITQILLEGIAKSGQRAVMLSGWAGLGDHKLPDNILLLDRVPHSWLFPRMGAVVHHGGAGTTAAGLRAGVPSLIIPHFADQPYWGERVNALGVGPKQIWRHRLTADRLAQGILQAVSSAPIRHKAATLGKRIRAEDGTGNAVKIMAELLN